MYGNGYGNGNGYGWGCCIIEVAVVGAEGE